MSYIVVNLTIDWVWFFALVGVVVAVVLGIIVELLWPTIKGKINARTQSIQRMARKSVVGSPKQVAAALTAAVQSSERRRPAGVVPPAGVDGVGPDRSRPPRTLADLR